MVPLQDGHALIVEDNPDTQGWLVSSVNSAFPNLSVCAVGTLAEACAAMKESTYDLGLPDGSGLEISRELGSGAHPCYVVVATIYDDDKNLFTALKSGAKGCVLKDQDVSYLQGTQKNRPALSAASSQRLIDHFNSQGGARDPASHTLREEDVIGLIGKGYSVEDAASMLNLAPDTIKGCVKSIYTKLGATNRSELTLEAIRLGVVESQ
jgi:DNA-binding NarL/FixJ family response regulator